MTRDDIIRMAREAGWDEHHCTYDTRIERFAALVAAAEREACINVCDTAYHQHIGIELGSVRYGIAVCAAAIRARGQE